MDLAARHLHREASASPRNTGPLGVPAEPLGQLLGSDIGLPGSGRPVAVENDQGHAERRPQLQLPFVTLAALGKRLEQGQADPSSRRRAFAEMPAFMPEAPQCTSPRSRARSTSPAPDAQSRAARRLSCSPSRRSSQVSEAGCAKFGSTQRRPAPRKKMACRLQTSLSFIDLSQPSKGKLTYRFQHLKTRLFAHPSSEEAVVQERGQAFDNIGDGASLRHSFGRLSEKPPTKTASRPKSACSEGSKRS